MSDTTQEIYDNLEAIERRSKGLSRGELKRLIVDAMEEVLAEQLRPSWDTGPLMGDDPSILHEMRVSANAVSPAN